MRKLGIIMLGMLMFIACGQEAKETVKEDKKPIKVGITQIVEHPSLEEIRKGIIDTLAKHGFNDGKEIVINYQNAQGEMANAQLIAKDFKGNSDIVIAITTPSAQAAFNVIKDVPVFFSAVTDPVSAGLEGDNITGVSDLTPVKKQIELGLQLMPEAKSIGIVYNIGETNSNVQVKMVEEFAMDKGIKIVKIGVNNVTEVDQALNVILPNVDMLYTPVDNLLASTYPLIVNKADNANVPVIAGVTDYVKKGALATKGINQYGIGVQTGEMIVKYLKGDKKLEQLPIEYIENTDLVINKEKLDKYKILLSDAIKKEAKLISSEAE